MGRYHFTSTGEVKAKMQMLIGYWVWSGAMMPKIARRHLPKKHSVTNGKQREKPKDIQHTNQVVKTGVYIVQLTVWFYKVSHWKVHCIFVL